MLRQAQTNFRSVCPAEMPFALRGMWNPPQEEDAGAKGGQRDRVPRGRGLVPLALQRLQLTGICQTRYLRIYLISPRRPAEQ